MYLHETEFFSDEILAVAEFHKLSPDIIEKDYYVTLLLKALKDSCPNIVFKGGTSLSKGYQVIDRFSEDVDITFSEKIGRKARADIKHNVIETISKKIGLRIQNLNTLENSSGHDYQMYLFEYPSMFQKESTVQSYLRKGEIQLELTYIGKSFPVNETISIDNFFASYVRASRDDTNDILSSLELAPFEMRVQSLERTFIDKVFALCDYAEKKVLTRHSRHIYDLYKIYPFIDHEVVRNNIPLVREMRAKDKKRCPSAQKGFSISSKIEEIVKSELFKEDYILTNERLLYKRIDYSEVITVLEKIIKDNWFRECIERNVGFDKLSSTHL